MTRAVLRHRVADPCAGVADDAFLNRAADAHTVEIQRGDLLCGVPAQILVIRALHHAIERLIRLAEPFLGEPLVLGHAALRPPVGAFHGAFLVAAGVHQRGQLIEGEHDVGADLVLDAHGDLGGETVLVAVEWGFERHAVLVHEREAFLAFGDHLIGLHARHVHGERLFEARAERQHLEAAGIGERRTVPVHEFGEAARFVKHLLAGTLEQVERVGQQALRAEVLHGFRKHGLHRGLSGDRYERRCVDVAVWRVDDAGTAVARTAAAFAVGGVRQPGFLLKVKRVATAWFAGLRSTRVLDEVLSGRDRTGIHGGGRFRCTGL